MKMDMELGHIPQGVLERFVEGRATRWERRQILAHLLRGCDSCAALAVRAYRPPVSEQVYEEVFDRVARRLVAEWGSEVRLPVRRGASACPVW
jgi:hypothetical protein